MANSTREHGVWLTPAQLETFEQTLAGFGALEELLREPPSQLGLSIHSGVAFILQRLNESLEDLYEELLQAQRPERA